MRTFGRWKSRWEDDIVGCRPLLANDLETNNGTTSVTRQQPWDKQIYQSHYWVTSLQTDAFPWKCLEYNSEQCFGRGPCRDVITETSLEVSQLRTVTARVQLKKKVSGRQSEEAWQQNELIGGTASRKVTVTFSQLRGSCKGVCEEKTWSVQLKNLHC
jgi:hypothetical protein